MVAVLHKGIEHNYYFWTTDMENCSLSHWIINENERKDNAILNKYSHNNNTE